jgi:hypothetical protein
MAKKPKYDKTPSHERVDIPHFKCKDKMPDNDRVVLIYSENYFGPDRWYPACWLGEDDKPAGEFCWAMDGLGYKKEEIGATHWAEMPNTPTPVIKKRKIKKT